MELAPKLTKASLLIASVFALSACVSYSSDKAHVHMSVPSDTPLTQIQPGESTTNWLIDTLGEPDAIRPGEAGSTVWQYENIHSEHKRLIAFPLISIKREHLQRTVYHFAIQDERIQRYWKEELN